MPQKKVKKAAVEVKSVKEVPVEIKGKSKVKAAKSSKAVKVKSSESTTSNEYIMIDFPIEGETVSGLHYAIKIGAAGDGRVELSINDGDWQQCRNADGYWWFDWGYFLPGPHKIIAQIVNNEGKVIKKTTRKCNVV